jgi:hypothetical protein
MTPTEKQRLGKRVVHRGQVTIYSDILNLTFRCPVDDARSPRLETFVTALEYLALNPKKR